MKSSEPEDPQTRVSQVPVVDTESPGERHRRALAWCRGIRKGEHAAIEAYYRTFFPLMLAEAERIYGPETSEALDLVQEACLKILRVLPEIRRWDQLEAWTRRVVRTVGYDQLRREARENQKRRQAARNSPPKSTDRDWHEREAKLQWLEKELAEQDELLRELVTLRYRAGWTLRRIAERLGMTTGAVDGRIQRWLKQLRRKVGTED